MAPLRSADAPATGVPLTPTGDQHGSPLAFVLGRLFPKRGGAPYAPAERLVALVVVRAMSRDEGSGACNCFLSYATIAKWAGISVASVKRMMQKHCDGPAPLFYRSRTGETRGHRHACYRFTLVAQPEKFAAARDATRLERVRTADQARRDLQPERVALQRHLPDFGGTLTDAEYGRRLAALERVGRCKIPTRAFSKRKSRWV